MLKIEIMQTIEVLLGYDVNKVEFDHIISKTIRIVHNYLNDDNLTDDDILEKYKDVIIELTYRYFKSSKIGSNGVKSMTQGQRSITYSDSVINPLVLDDEIKALLPLPKVRLI